MKIYALLFFIAIFASCQQRENNTDDTAYVHKRMVNVNKYLAEKDKDVIEHFIRRKGWQMKIDENGLYYEIFENSQPLINDANVVTFNYEVSLLNGTVCYSSETEGAKTVNVKGEELSGLYHALRKLGKNGRGRFILLPSMAYGLPGDLDQIPPRATIVYSVEILSVE